MEFEAELFEEPSNEIEKEVLPCGSKCFLITASESTPTFLNVEAIL
jgi:hypothetical protein